MEGIDRRATVREGFHQAKWDEPIIFELSNPGERGIGVPEPEDEIAALIPDPLDGIPAGMQRTEAPALPEISQPRVLRHYMRLSQQTLGADVNIEIGQGTCTVKYSPKINEALARLPQVTALHPLQPEETVQGMLEIFYKTDTYLREISGLDRFTFQPGGGSQGILTMASVVHNYFEDRGEERDEIITTIYSHPSDAAAPAVKGYRIIHIGPDKDGYPDFEAFKAAVGPRTAAFFVANPEDTGVYNPRVKEFTDLVHAHGGLCGYDQANANGLIGVTRAREAGFDLCFFNLHKTFSTPHGCGGPACGATGCTAALAPFLPGPLIDEKAGPDGQKVYFLDRSYLNDHRSVGKVRSWYGVAPVVLKAYAWIRAMGAEGLWETAKVAVLNNNYLFKKLMEIDCVDAPYIRGKQRVEQVRYTIEKLTADTGITSGDIQRRMMDFGMHYWTSHHPYHIPEPITLEPTETPSKADLDEYIETLKFIFKEAYDNPEKIRTAPHRSVCHQVDSTWSDDPKKWCITWRAYLKKTGKKG